MCGRYALDADIDFLINQYKAIIGKTKFDNIRKLGGAIFCDRRYDTVFMYHNGAESYYGARGFRGILRV